MNMKANHSWLRRHKIMVKSGAAIMGKGGWDASGGGGVKI
jgi:hypothetical protein